MTSMTYWNVADNVRGRLNQLAEQGVEMYGNLEADDNPGEMADSLAVIAKELSTLLGEVEPNVAALRRVAKAHAEIPGVKQP